MSHLTQAIRFAAPLALIVVTSRASLPAQPNPQILWFESWVCGQVGCLDLPDPRVAVPAAAALVQMDHAVTPRAARRLIAALASPDLAIRAEAAAALLDHDLARTKALPVAHQVLTRPETEPRFRVARALAGHHPEADNLLRAVATRPGDARRLAALRALVRRARPSAALLALLTAALDDADPAVQALAVEGLGRFTGSTAIPRTRLRRLVEEENAEFRIVAAASLVRLGVVSPGLVRILALGPAFERRESPGPTNPEAKDPSLGLRALRAGGPDVITAYRDLLDEDGRIHAAEGEAAEHAMTPIFCFITDELKRLGPAAAPALPELRATVRACALNPRGRGALEVLAAMGPAARPAIPEIVTAARETTRAWFSAHGVADALVAIDADASAEALFADWKRTPSARPLEVLIEMGARAKSVGAKVARAWEVDRRSPVLTRAAAATGGSKAALKVLLGSADDHDVRFAAWVVRERASKAADLVPDLLRALEKHEGAWVRDRILAALGAIGPGAGAAVPAVVGIVEDDGLTAGEALHALGRIDGARAETLALDRLDHPRVDWAARAVLLSRDTEPVRKKLRVELTAGWSRRLAVAAGLSDLPPDRAVRWLPEITAWMNEATSRLGRHADARPWSPGSNYVTETALVGALESLARLGKRGAAARETMLRLARVDSERVRRAALEALVACLGRGARLPVEEAARIETRANRAHARRLLGRLGLPAPRD